RARQDRLRRIPAAAEDTRRRDAPASAVCSRVGCDIRQRSDADWLLSPEPAEYEYRQADAVDDGRCVPQVATCSGAEPSTSGGVQLRCESTTIVLRCSLRHGPRDRPRRTPRNIAVGSRLVASTPNAAGLGARTHGAAGG